jgi:phenylpyruvate tautomerase PptA (4-oxalocrotonate tautomerase family)
MKRREKNKRLEQKKELIKAITEGLCRGKGYQQEVLCGATGGK